MSLEAYNNVFVPAFMYGTAWKKDATANLVLQAVEAGFRAVDTANQLIHYDEAKVGEALLVLRDKGLERKDLFLQSKFTSVHGQDHRTPYDASADLTAQVQQSFASSLQHLYTDYLDSYLLHGPYSRFGLGAEDWAVWGAIEDIYKSGGARIIGISNVTAQQLLKLCEKSKVKPMVVQNRCFAITGWDKDVREICRERNIIYQAFSLLTANGQVVASATVRSIAKRLRCEPAQVIFCFARQMGMLPLTGTTNLEHMQMDLQIEKMTLLPDEVAQMASIAR